MKAEYIIPAVNLPRLAAGIELLNRRCRKLRITEIILRTVSAELIEGVPHLAIEVTGDTPKLAGWEFAAVLEADAETGKMIIRKLPSFKRALPTQYRTCEQGCDHCQTNRWRKLTYVVAHDDGGFKQVGSTCLGDFLGTKSPHSLAFQAEYWLNINDLVANCRNMEGGGGGSHEVLVGMDDFVARAFAVVRTLGWMGKGKAQEIEQKEGRAVTPTADHVRRLLLAPLRERQTPQWKDLNDKTAITPEDMDNARLALEYVRGWKDANVRSDYEHNLRVAVAGELMPIRRAGIVASIARVWSRKQENEPRKAAAQGHVGQPGQKVRGLAVTVEKVIPCQGMYGLSLIHKMVTPDGKKLVWFSSGTRLPEGKIIGISATVKDHKTDPKWGDETTLTRCALA